MSRCSFEAFHGAKIPLAGTEGVRMVRIELSTSPLRVVQEESIQDDEYLTVQNYRIRLEGESETYIKYA
jgi:hypothetical protein